MAQCVYIGQIGMRNLIKNAWTGVFPMVKWFFLLVYNLLLSVFARGKVIMNSLAG